MDLEILPQRRTLHVEPGANLLEALLANDVAISHSCRAGRCGTCRCRLISGEVADAGNDDRLVDAAPGQLLACRTTLSGPCVIEVVETDEPIFHPARIIKATVVAIDDMTHDIRRLRLRPSKPLAFSPGQYALLQFTPDHIRPYSMAGLCTDDELEFHVRLVPDGLVTGHVAGALKVGDSVRVSGPLGSAYLRRKHEGPMLCVAGGTGLAPILSIIRGARAAGMTNPIHLYFGVRSTRDVYGQSWIERLTSEAPNLHVHVVVATGAEDSGHRSGPVTDAVAHDWPRLDGWRAYLCGAPPMVEAASTLVQRAGIAPDRIHADAFYAHAPLIGDDMLALTPTRPTVQRDREAYYARIAASHMTPLWEVLGALVPTSPRTEASPAIWHYTALRDQVLEAGDLITAEEAERRVLILENPSLKGQSCITPSLYAGLQLILPGEVAPAHRHMQSALRLVLDGEGAYTSVDGERTTMHRGDFIITPSWTWHDHGNLGNEPVVWLDGLDIPLLRFLGAGFAEKSALASQPQLRPEGDALARYGSNMVPVDVYQKPSDPTRLFVYPFSRTRDSLAAIAEGRPDAAFGHKLRYVNPATGASPMPTIGAFAQALPSGFETSPYRCTDGTVYVCLEGAGEAEIGGTTHRFEESDVFVVPSWHALRLRASRATTLFSFSDRPVQQALGLWREERL